MTDAARLQPGSQRDGAVDAPSGECSTHGRDNRGRFAAGNLAAFVHGARSRQVQQASLPAQVEALAILAERRQAIEADLGGADALSVLTRDMVTRYLELSIVADYLGGRLVTEGPLTTKGRQRAALTAFLGVVDRQTRLASTLGLDRRPRALTGSTLAAWLAEQQRGAADAE